MNTNLYQEAIKEATKDKYGRRRQLQSRYIPFNPDSCEREMKRLSNSYLRIINHELKAVLPDIMNEYRRQMRNDSRMDGITDIRLLMKKKFAEAAEKAARSAEDSKIVEKIEQMSRRIKNVAVGEWKKTVKTTLDIDIPEDYYSDDLYQGALKTWSDDIVQKMRELPRELGDKMQDVIQSGYASGKSPTRVQNELQEEYNKAKRGNASRWAESVAYLNAQVNKKNQEDAGVKKYVWHTRRDARVRPCHQALDGRIVYWDDPPVQWYETKSRGRVYSGQRAHPGESYGCRCYAVPIFEKEHFNPPVSAESKGKTPMEFLQELLSKR